MAVTKVTVRVEFEDGGSAEQTFHLDQPTVDRIQYRHGGVLRHLIRTLRGALNKA